MTKWLKRGFGGASSASPGSTTAYHPSPHPPPPMNHGNSPSHASISEDRRAMPIDPPATYHSNYNYDGASQASSTRTGATNTNRTGRSRNAYSSTSVSSREGRTSSRDRKKAEADTSGRRSNARSSSSSRSHRSNSNSRRTGGSKRQANGSSNSTNPRSPQAGHPFPQHAGGTPPTPPAAPPSNVERPHPPQSQASPASYQNSFNQPSHSDNSPNNFKSSSQDPSLRRPAYLLHRDLVIGKGSYGQVCIASRGEAEGHGRSGKRKKFACKCVILRNDPKYIAKLQEEVNVLRELRGHDNIIRLYDVFCVDNELFIMTELGRGGDLFHLLTTHPKHGVTEAYAAKTVAQMLSSVAFLHSRHICHRDLKLENWVLESGRDVWSPLKLIDFGLSTHYTPGHRLSRVVGSSYYVAPEVLKKSYTEACDLWSLGVIVYMLLSGAPPFYGKNDEAIKASIVNGEYTFPHELFRDVSDEAMAFVSTLLSYNTDYRYTADQALTHPWLASNCDPEQLQRAKDGARGHGFSNENDSRPVAMEM